MRQGFTTLSGVCPSMMNVGDRTTFIIEGGHISLFSLMLARLYILALFNGACDGVRNFRNLPKKKSSCGWMGWGGSGFFFFWDWGGREREVLLYLFVERPRGEFHVEEDV